MSVRERECAKESMCLCAQYAHVNVLMCMLMCLCAYVLMCACVHVCAHVCMYVHMCAHVCACVRMCAHVSPYVCASCTPAPSKAEPLKYEVSEDD